MNTTIYHGRSLKSVLLRTAKSDHFLDNATVGLMNLLVRLRGLILLPLFTKHLGFGDYGIWVQCVALSTMLSTFFEFNLHTYMVRCMYEVKNPADQGRIYISALAILIIINLFFILLTTILFQVVDLGDLLLQESSASNLLFLSVLSAPFMAFLDFNLNYYRAIQKIRFQVIFNTMVNTMELLGVLVSLIFFGLFEALFFVLIWRILAAGGTCLHVLTRIGFTAPRWQYVRDAAHFSTPLLLSNISTLVINRGDRILIGVMFGNSILGMYAVGANLGSLFASILAPFNVTLFPKMSKLWTQNEQAAIRLVESYRHFFFLAAIPAFAFTVVFGHNLVMIFSQSQAANTQTYIALLTVSLGNIFWGMCVFETFVLYGHKNTKAVGLIRFGAALLNVALNLVLLPRFGYGAAGVSLLVSYIILFFGYRYYSQSKLAFHFARLFGNIGMAFALTFIISIMDLNLYSPWIMLPTIAVYAIIYTTANLVGLILLKRTSKTDD